MTGTFSRLVAVSCSAILLTLATGFISVKLVEVYHYGYFDMPIFVNAARHFWAGTDIYIKGGNLAWDYSPGAPVFKFPLPYLFLLIPWFSGEFPEWFRGFYTVSAAVLFISSIAMTASFYPRDGSKGLCQQLFLPISIFLGALFMPFYRGVGVFGVENLVLFLLASAFFVLRRFPLLAGFLMAYAAAIKVYPVFMLVFLVYNRQWRAIAGWVAGFILLFTLSFAVFGAKENLFYINTIFPLLMQEGVVWHPESLNIEQYLFAGGWISEVSGRIFYPLRGCLLGLTGMVMWLVRKSPVVSGDPLMYGLLMVTMLLCLPNYWYSYMVLMIFPFIACLGHVINMRHYWLLLVLAAIYLMATCDYSLAITSAIDSSGLEYSVSFENMVKEKGFLLGMIPYSPLAAVIWQAAEWRIFAAFGLWLVSVLLILQHQRQQNLRAV